MSYRQVRLAGRLLLSAWLIFWAAYAFLEGPSWFGWMLIGMLALEIVAWCKISDEERV